MAVIKDVATLAQVSVGTVSKYLNNPENLKDSTRNKVEQAIATLQYTPSPLARSMRTGKTNTIAVIAPDISNPFYVEVYNSIRESSVASGYTPILYTTGDDIETLKAYLLDISLRMIDGIILCFVEENELIENMISEMQSKIPIVSLSWDINNTRFNYVSVDVFDGVFKSTNHLIDLGHKSIAYIGGMDKNTISKEKHSGYMKAMKNADLEINPEFVYRGDFNLKTGYYAAKKYDMCPSRPTAIVAENDILALGSMKYFLQRGIKVPEDIAIIGFDNIALSRMYEPPLSTISLPIPQMGEEALKLLLSGIVNPNSSNKLVILQNQLIIRNSTDKNAPLQFEL